MRQGQHAPINGVLLTWQIAHVPLMVPTANLVPSPLHAHDSAGPADTVTVWMSPALF